MKNVTTELLHSDITLYEDIVFVCNNAQMLKYICYNYIFLLVVFIQ